ncbi:MAG TPA: phytanoyl-CoA dioxygenase family protein [Ilumatobacter sp.]|nr:phytanoyl-CoA dioxygenase family protein [Ilumatobacter sp.]
MRTMTDRELYLFDIQGFVVVEGFLSDAEVARLNDAVDANADQREACGESIDGSSTLTGSPRLQYTGMLAWERPWCEPFRELLAPTAAVPYLNTMLGRGWHMDTEPVYFHYGQGTGGLLVHQGEHFFHPGAYYVHKNGRMHNGVVVFQYTLSDQNEGDGGFACIPGSHKANYPRPASITRWEDDQSLMHNPTVRAGDLLIFTEAVAHGTLPWTAAHERRAMHYRYAPKFVQFGGGVHTFDLPTWADELTEAQQAVLEPAYYYHRPLVGPDGSVSRPLLDMYDWGHNGEWEDIPVESPVDNASTRFLKAQMVERKRVG